MSNIYLIGARACGKTTAGRKLADMLGMNFHDSDACLVEKAGCEIAEYVQKFGWDVFRDLECEVLRGLAGAHNAVVSCGGGIVVREENRAILSGSYTVYLKVEERVLAERLAADPAHEQRPSLTGRPLIDEIKEILTEREPLYTSCASFIADGSAPVDEVCSRISVDFKVMQNGE